MHMFQVAIVKAFNGIGLAMVVPAIQSLVADMHREGERGLGFGFLHGAGQVGTLLGGVFATLLGARTVGVIAGWRFAFFLMAIVSVLLAAAIYIFAEDLKPPPPVDLVRSIKASLLLQRCLYWPDFLFVILKTICRHSLTLVLQVYFLHSHSILKGIYISDNYYIFCVVTSLLFNETARRHFCLVHDKRVNSNSSGKGQRKC